MNKLHIVSFDVPFPANYGGVIDVFYKLKFLREQGVEIYFHCFEYGRGQQVILNNYCKEVYYYKRNTSFFQHFTLLPFIVKSRKNKELLNNLSLIDAPILFEGLHTCGFLNDARLKDRFKIYRESNIEHEYYFKLAESESSLLKKIYFFIEAIKLKRFEKTLVHSDLMLTVSKKDNEYLKQKFPNNLVEYLPSFHPYKACVSNPGKGDYVLYHGNLQISENHLAAMFLVKEVFTEPHLKYIIAGLNPKSDLKNLIAIKDNIELIENPDQDTLNELIQHAHINCLVSFQKTGLKLKLLHALFAGRFCMVNDEMLYGTDLSELCIIGNSAEELRKKIKDFFNYSFTEKETSSREQKLKLYNVELNAKRILEIVQKRNA